MSRARAICAGLNACADATHIVVQSKPFGIQESLISPTSMPTQKFKEWVEKLIDDEDAYAYRYILGAYNAVVSNDKGYYYKLVPEPQRNQLMDTASQRVELVFDSDAEKKEFTDYLFKRFCGDNHQSMDEWHDLRMRWHGEDLDNA